MSIMRLHPEARMGFDAAVEQLAGVHYEKDVNDCRTAAEFVTGHVAADERVGAVYLGNKGSVFLQAADVDVEAGTIRLVGLGHDGLRDSDFFLQESGPVSLDGRLAERIGDRQEPLIRAHYHARNRRVYEQESYGVNLLLLPHEEPFGYREHRTRAQRSGLRRTSQRATILAAERWASAITTEPRDRNDLRSIS